GTEKTNIPDKKQVTNLSDITTNDNTSILLPSSHEEVISEVSRKEEVMIPSSEAGNSSSVTPIKTVVSAPSTNVVSKETTGETVANEVVTGLTENGDSNASTTTDSFTNIVKESSISSTTNNGIKSIEPTSQTITITERVVRLTEGLPYQVVYQEDNTLTVGQTSVVSEGSLGEKVSIQNVVLKDGVEVSRETTSTTVNKEPVNRIVKVGTKDPASQVNS
ncbi:G5 domain-containing protein, partial [Streptococcus pneumoniae]